MEQRFGHPLTRVRVHADAAAAQSAPDVDARAYTVGHDIVFGAGQYAPDTNQGRRLIAHELTHVVQQSGADGYLQRAGLELSTTEGQMLPAPEQPPASLGVGLDQPDCGTRVSDVFWLGQAFHDPARPECSFAEIYERKDMSHHFRYRADLPLATTPPCKDGNQESHDFWLMYGKNEWRILEIRSTGVTVLNACGDEEILGTAPTPVEEPEIGVRVEESHFGPGRVVTSNDCETVFFIPDGKGKQLEWTLEKVTMPRVADEKCYVPTEGKNMPREPAELSAMLRVYLTREMSRPTAPATRAGAGARDRPGAGRPVERQ